MTGALVQQFDVFAQLIAQESIAGCAHALDISPADVITAMNGLEDHLGFTLFSVNDEGVKLTDTGRKVAEALAQLTLEEQEQWAETLAYGGLSIEALPTAGEIEAPALPAMETGAPTIEPVEDDAPAAPEQPEDDEMPGTMAALPAASDEADDAPVTPKHFRPQNPRPPSTAVAIPSPDAIRTITLASHPAIFTHFQEALVAFEEASPDIGISLRLSGIDETDVEALFRNELADIAYFYALGEEEGIRSRYAWSERISLFVGKDCPLAANEAVMADDLAKLSYAALDDGNISRRLTEQALTDSGIDLRKPAIASDNLYEIMKFIESHDAYFPAFGAMARDFGKMSGIRRLSYAQALPQVQVRQAVRDAVNDDPAVLALAEFLFR